MIGLKKHRCRLPEGVAAIKPDGVNELDPCSFRTKEIHRNVTVEVNQCSVCGRIDVVWHRQEDTEDEISEELEEECYED